ncbi:hypothetical protein FACS189413_05680 [Bacteroidia bacterium]|nr:hypothetical protein FACS189413_05680 [Bacteroidia bacterium]
MKIDRILYFLSIVLFISNISEIAAVPANPNPITMEQPDGTIITYFIRGDEKVHWMQSADGYTLLRNDRQFVVYATHDAAGDLVPSQHIYRPELLRSASEKSFLSTLPKNLLFSEQQVQTKLLPWNTSTGILRSDTGAEIRKAPVLGAKKALCVLVNFTDKKTGYSIQNFDQLLNGATNSVKDFYRENSYGKMDLTVDIIGPYEMSNTAEYYGSLESRWSGFAKSVIQQADADPNVDLSEYAINGKIETFHIIFAGYGDESIDNGKQIWSHKSQFSSFTLPNSKVKASVYSCSPELSGSSGNKLTNIGVICHELCHVFGADDFYDIDYNESGNGSFPATGRWDLMADGSWNGNGTRRDGSRPAHINMFQKILYGWVAPDTLQTPLSVTDMPNAEQNPVAYIIKPYANNEMYVLENRQKTGYDSDIPGNGLIIYHIHDSAANGVIDNTRHPQRAYVVCASATTAIPTSGATPASTVASYGSVNSANAPFASNTVRNEFSGSSTPRMFRWNGTAGITVTDKPLTEITQQSGLIAFNFNCLPVTNISATVDDTQIHLSWTAPANSSESVVYQYNIYVNNVLAAENISATTWDYQPETVRLSYKFAIQAHSGECSAKITEKEIPFHPALTFDFQEADGIFLTNQVYPVSVQTIGNGALETITYDWSFSNNLATIEPDENEDDSVITLKTGAEEGSGILKVEVHYYTYPVSVLEKEITIQKPEAITLAQLPDIQIYPNPVQNILNLKAETPVAVSITDLNGRTIYRNAEITSLSLPVQSWDKGVYLIRLQTVTEIKVIKLIKQ